RAEAGDFGHVLAHQLIQQAAGAHLVLRLLGVLGTHVAAQRGGNFVFGHAADLLGVVFTVEEIGVNPLAAVLEEAAVFGCRRVAGGAGHLFSGAQRAQIIDAAHRVGAVELHVVGVVLHAFQDAVAVGVPAAGDPGEFQGSLDAGPDAAQPFEVAGEPPIEIGVHYLAHGAVGGGEAPERLFVRQVLAEVQGAGGVEIVSETDGAQGAGKGGEQVGGGGFVVPDVGATAVAAAGVIVGALEAVELAVGGTEADGRDQGGEIGAGGVLDGGGDGGLAEGGGKAAGLLFQGTEVRGDISGSGPGVGEAGGVVVAYEGVLVALGSVPAAAARRAIGEVPGEEEGEIGMRAGRDGAVEAESADGADFGGFGAEFAIGREIVPKEHGGVPPAVARPAAQGGDVGAGGVESGEGEAALERIRGGKVGAGHEETGEVGGGAILVHPRVDVGRGRRPASGGVFDGPGDGDLGSRCSG